MEHPVLKTLAIIISVLLIIVAGFGMYQYNKETRAERKVLEEVAGPVNDQLSRLYSKRDELQLELEDIEAEMSIANDSLCSAMILVSECKDKMLEDIFPITDEYGYPGIITISERYYPGMQGCITWEDVDMLTNRGWDICISANDTSTLSELKQIFTSVGREMPKTIYYPNGACSEDAEKVFVSVGFDTIIEYAGFTSGFEEGKLWHVPAQGTYNKLSADTVRNSISVSEPIAMTIGYERADEMYNKSNISNMLKLFNDYEKKGSLEVTNLEGARVRYKQHLANVDESASKLQGKYDAKKAEIDEVNAKIDDLRK